MPDGSPYRETREEREARWRREAEAKRDAWLAAQPDPDPELLEEQNAANAAALAERPRKQYRPRCEFAYHQRLTSSLPEWTLRHCVGHRVSDAALRVFAVLRIYSKPSRPWCRLARSEIACIAKVSDRHVRRCILELERAKLIHAQPEERIGRQLSETRAYDLNSDLAWPRVGDAPAAQDRATRRRSYDMNDTPSGGLTTPSGRAPRQKPDAGASAGEGRAAGPPAGRPALPSSPDGSPGGSPGALARGERASAVPGLAAAEPCPDAAQVDREEWLAARPRPDFGGGMTFGPGRDL
jgi:hypothetical protein